MGNDNTKGSTKSYDGHNIRTFDEVEGERLKHTFKLLSGGSNHTLSAEKFESGLCSAIPDYGRKLFKNTQQSSLNEEQFVKWGKDVMGFITISQQMEFYIGLFSNQENQLTQAECEELCVCCYQASMCVAGMSGTDISQAPEVKAVLKSMFSSEESLSSGEVMSWCGRHCKKLFDSLHHYTTSVLRGDTSLGKQPTGASMDASAEGDTSGGSKLLGTVLRPCLAWLLSCHLPSGYIPSVDHDIGGLAAFSSALAGVLHPTGWQLLFSSNIHGAGKTRFLHHILHYKAPTVMLLSFEEHVYVVAADSEWKEDVKRWGGDDCMLLQALPTYRQMTAGANLLWFNVEDRTMPKGISIGKETRTTFVEIDEEMSNVKHYGVECKLQAIEVWGCGGMKALEEQRKQQNWEHQQAEKAKGRKLKLEDWRDNPDKQLLDMGGVTTEHAER